MKNEHESLCLLSIKVDSKKCKRITVRRITQQKTI